MRFPAVRLAGPLRAAARRRARLVPVDLSGVVRLVEPHPSNAIRGASFNTSRGDRGGWRSRVRAVDPTVFGRYGLAAR